jgi:hypothetical protein
LHGREALDLTGQSPVVTFKGGSTNEGTKRMLIAKIVAIVVGIAVAVWLIDRLFLYFEARGWLYWRKKKAAPGVGGNALLELHSILEPDKGHMAEQLREEHVEVDENGDPLEPQRRALIDDFNPNTEA